MIKQLDSKILDSNILPIEMVEKLLLFNIGIYKPEEYLRLKRIIKLLSNSGEFYNGQNRDVIDCINKLKERKCPSCGYNMRVYVNKSRCNNSSCGHTEPVEQVYHLLTKL